MKQNDDASSVQPKPSHAAFGEVIEDPSDARLDDFRDLKHSDARPDLPGGKGLVIGEGPLVVERMLESRFPVRCVLGFPAKLATWMGQPGVRDLLGEVPVSPVARAALAQAAGFDLHRGLIASADRPAPLSVEEALRGARTVAILEGVNDHENIGSMFRNAAGMGVDAILFGPGCADPLYRRVVRVSMGHVLRTPFARFEGTRGAWRGLLTQLREQGFFLVSLTPAPGAVHLADAMVDANGVPHNKVGLLIGAEGPGLAEQTMQATDVRAVIPMAPGTDSLNLATAAAIAFYERLRGTEGRA